MGVAFVRARPWWEERDLVTAFGSTYLDYRARAPMLIPRVRARRSAAGRTAGRAVDTILYPVFRGDYELWSKGSAVAGAHDE
jgi:hypothetical protein